MKGRWKLSCNRSLDSHLRWRPEVNFHNHLTITILLNLKLLRFQLRALGILHCVNTAAGEQDLQQPRATTYSTMAPIYSRPTKYREVKQKKNEVPTPIPLNKVEIPLLKGKYATYKLRTNPANETSATNEIQVPYFKTGTPEQLLDFLEMVNQVIRGQALTDGASRFALMRTLLQGDALTAFNGRARALNNVETLETFARTVQYLKYHVFPQQALILQVRYMRREMRKPADMSFRVYQARVFELNEQLAQYPNGQTDPITGHALGFQLAQRMSPSDMLDIIHYGLPKSWQKKMLSRGFDVLSHANPERAMTELKEFCERREFMEAAEAADKMAHHGQKPTTQMSVNKQGATSPAKSSDGSNKSRNKKRKISSFESNDNDDPSQRWCPLHRIYGHDSRNCVPIQEQVKKMRAMWDNPDSAQRKRNERADKKRHDEQLRSTIQAMVDASMKQKYKKRSYSQVRFAEEEQQEQEPTKANLKNDSDYETSEDEAVGDDECAQFQDVNYHEDDDESSTA